MRKKAFIITIGILTFGILTFIHFSNDHKECSKVTEHHIGQNGEKISTERHICKERFNF